MATIKSFTDLQQSRKLAKILSLESADMAYYFMKDSGLLVNLSPFILDGTEVREDGMFTYLNCWSLAALLKILNFPSLTQNKEDEWEVCVFDHNNDDYIKKTANNPVDACIAMIERLYKLKML